MWTVRYARRAGRSDWVFGVDSEELAVTVEIFPTKLDYDSDLDELVADIANVERLLSIEYFRSTYETGSLSRDVIGTRVDWLTILRSKVHDLHSALAQISARPFHALAISDFYVSIDKIAQPTSSTVAMLSRGRSTDDMVHVPGIGTLPSRIMTSRSMESLDTPEHRWLKARLRDLSVRLREAASLQRTKVEAVRGRSGRSPTRLSAELHEIEDVAATIDRALNLPFLAAADESRRATSASLQLQSGIGYREAYQALVSLSSAVNNKGENVSYSLADLHDLYERWCLVSVAKILSDMSTPGSVEASERMTPVVSGGSLAKGAKSRILFEVNGRRVELAYNKSYSMPTGTQIPDIVLSVRSRPDGTTRTMILDAKYRLDASAEYIQKYGSPGAPVDAVNALHRYRDAIRPTAVNRDVPIIEVGAALFPWPNILTSDEYGMRASIDQVGIGAIPFLPGNVQGLSDLISEFLSGGAFSSDYSANS